MNLIVYTFLFPLLFFQLLPWENKPCKIEGDVCSSLQNSQTRALSCEYKLKSFTSLWDLLTSLDFKSSMLFYSFTHPRRHQSLYHLYLLKKSSSCLSCKKEAAEDSVCHKRKKSLSPTNNCKPGYDVMVKSDSCLLM